jgi:hypothetical protein
MLAWRKLLLAIQFVHELSSNKVKYSIVPKIIPVGARTRTPSVIPQKIQGRYTPVTFSQITDQRAVTF